MPVVSVILPSYNHERYLSQCLDSVQEQTFRDWELVAIDDCSQDGSVEILRRYASKDSRIRVMVNERNLGTYPTQQKALELCESPYVAVINSDDFWELDKLEEQVSVIERHPECSLCFSLARHANEFGEPFDDPLPDWPLSEVMDILPHLLAANRIIACSVLFRREGLRFEPTCKYMGDKVALIERSMYHLTCCVRSPLAYWRQHSRNTYVRSVGQVREDIQNRMEICRIDSGWYRRPFPSEGIAESLIENAKVLYRLSTYAGYKPGIRTALWTLLRHHYDPKSSVKRLVSTGLPADYLREHLFHGVYTDLDGVDPKEVVERTTASPPFHFYLSN